MKKEKLLIIGTGALATLFAARFSAVGTNVTMLGSWDEGLAALNEKGARLIDLSGKEKSYPVQAVTECKSARYAIVLVKSWQTEHVARQLEACLAPDGLAVTLQNGLGNGKILANILGTERVAQGVTTTGAALLAPGIARVGGEGLVSIETHSRLGALTALLTEAGFQTEVVSSAASLIWSKLVINTAINPLTALLNIHNGELLERPSARLLMSKLAIETASVAAAQNIPLSFDDPVKAAEDVAQRTANNISSMLQDLRRGAPTEIEAICGAIVRIGKAYQIETPLNKTFAQLVRACVEQG
ncbi:MAG: 2-dehydropantoate 2-reductase [Anaerolineae bacterium]|nr:2-dehydropantoate 2-reductase [Anaerolineae bacterium]MBT7071055.1 2-dehydropantoate 2-reductase [Anaerolineae bacterium]MBT7323761.1 2-dehydropantoate 2-reductase [Anaerolineae bacterium]